MVLLGLTFIFFTENVTMPSSAIRSTTYQILFFSVSNYVGFPQTQVVFLITYRYTMHWKLLFLSTALRNQLSVKLSFNAFYLNKPCLDIVVSKTQTIRKTLTTIYCFCSSFHKHQNSWISHSNKLLDARFANHVGIMWRWLKLELCSLLSIATAFLLKLALPAMNFEVLCLLFSWNVEKEHWNCFCKPTRTKCCKFLIFSFVVENFVKQPVNCIANIKTIETCLGISYKYA